MGVKDASPYIMEFIGTFMLCLTVAGAAKLSALAPLGIGGVLMCMIYAGAHVSGANYNPAVSLALAITGNLTWPKAVIYMAVQLAGGGAAALAGAAMLADNEVGHPAVNTVDFNPGAACAAEVFYTFALCFVVLNTACAKTNTPNQFYGLAIGFTVTAGACAGGPVSGGAFNPAVGLGLPIMAADFMPGVPIYFLGPFAGAALAAGAYMVTSMGGLMGALMMEFIGTFMLCLTVAGAAKLSPLAPLAIGGILMCMIYAGGHVSGANYNPAVSFALALTSNLEWPKAMMYMGVQLFAGFVAAACGAVMIADSEIGHPAVSPAFNAGSAAVSEFFYTFALCFVVLNVACAKPNAGNQFYGLAIGFTVTAGACSGGGVSGGAFNPAVGLGLPLVAGDPMPGVVIYLTCTFAGAAMAAGAYYLTNPDEFIGKLAPDIAEDKQKLKESA